MLLLLLWAGLLFSTIGIAASDFFCVNLSTIASILGMSESMAGVTFLAFGNGSPDVFSTFAAVSTHSGSLAVGELIGAAGFITAVVAGSMAIVRPFRVAKNSFVRDVGFFIVAASFSLVFLADGRLHIWECAVMVAFYVFYVVTVVIWHWYLRRRRRQNFRDALARNYFDVDGGNDDNIALEADEEVGHTGRGRATSHQSILEDFAALERDEESFSIGLNEDADDETRDRLMAEIRSNMRVNRPPIVNRRSTVNPIRPSLVGALEFRAVLSSLYKSRNIQTTPINLRRYSDDPSLALAQQSQNLATTSDPQLRQIHADGEEAVTGRLMDRGIGSDTHSAVARVRAASANDAVGLQRNPPNTERLTIPQIGLLVPTPPHTASMQCRSGECTPTFHQLPSAGLLNPLSNNDIGKSTQPSSISSTYSTDRLAPPQDYRDSILPTYAFEGRPLYGRTESPESKIDRQFSGLSMPGTAGSSPALPFPPYHDDPEFIPFTSRPPSLRLPLPSIGSDSVSHGQLYNRPSLKPISWWPYNILPSPGVLISTLFPTLYSWHDKKLWEKVLGVVAAPSVFLLTITLPVVESAREEDTSGTVKYDPNLVTSNGNHQAPLIGPTIAPPTDHDILVGLEGMSNTLGQQSLAIQLPHEAPRSHASPSDACRVDRLSRENFIQDGMNTEHPVFNRFNPAGHTTWSRRSTDLLAIETSEDLQPSSPKGWNRWLISTQIFTAPMFVVSMWWVNTDSTMSARNFLVPCLYTLLGSSLVLVVVLLTTNEAKPPRHRYLLCFLGFIVSIAWISTIASEVVGVLKAFGVILGISDAILGLTIFAVGNSLGDLVANITVARLGYPVMALSACFGGPMLNILLGIGLSGLYMTITHGNGVHDRHPTRPVKYIPYELDVGGTLIISGITLLVTLVGLLVAVPLNKWQMDRKIGWGLVILWCCSTVVNLSVEIFGWVGAST